MSLGFLGEFVRNPKAVGAIAPSSKVLARMMVAEMDLPRASVVAEYGPGTGAFTQTILDSLAPGATYFAIERGAKMAAIYRSRFPQARLFEGSVEKVESFAESLGASQVDAILCGLPWAAFDPALQDALLAPTLRILKPGGRFATFAYLQGLLLPAGRRFRDKLNEHFSEVRTSPTVWRNLPPAFVYRCVK